jgi:hypothetical protein
MLAICDAINLDDDVEGKILFLIIIKLLLPKTINRRKLWDANVMYVDVNFMKIFIEHRSHVIH